MRWWDELRAITKGEVGLFDVGAPGTQRRRLLLVGLWLREAVAAARRAELPTLASALTYKTLLSLVPVLAVALAILSSVQDGRYTRLVVDYLRNELPFDHRQLDGVIEMVENLARNAWKVAGGGALFFLWTVVSLFTTIENAFGAVWRVGRGRSWQRRFPVYVTTIVLVPPLFALSIWVSSRLAEWSAAGGPWLGRLVMIGSAWGLMVIGMTVFYYLMPATRVRVAAAVLGGFLAGTLLEAAKAGFRAYVSWTATTYENMYGALLALPLTLLWIWLAWAIVLGGAEFAFVAQNFRALASERDLARRGGSWRPRAAAWGLRVAAEVWRRGGDPSHLDEELSRRADLPSHRARAVLEDLAAAGVLRRLADVEDGYVPARDLSGLSLADAVVAVRGGSLSMGGVFGGGFDGWLEGRFSAAMAAELAVLSEPDWGEVLERECGEGGEGGGGGVEGGGGEGG